MASVPQTAPVQPQGSGLTPPAILSLLNSVRTDPKSFLAAVEKRLESYKDNKYRDTANQKFKSSEGPSACKELHQLLEKHPALPPLVHEDALSSIAQTHCDQISAEGVVSHIGGSGMEIAQRLDEKGEWSGRYNECIAVQTTTPTDLLLKWLIDDGIQNRGDRKALLIEKASKIGIGVNLHHKTHQVCVVAILVEHFGPKGSPDLPKPVENSNITNELPDDIKELPSDALSMNIFRRTISENGVKKITYHLKYEMKDGTSKEVIKVYSQKNDGALIPVTEGNIEPVKKPAQDPANKPAQDPPKEPNQPANDSSLPPPLPLLPAAPSPTQPASQPVAPPGAAPPPPQNTAPPAPAQPPASTGIPPPPPDTAAPPAPAASTSVPPPPPGLAPPPADAKAVPPPASTPTPPPPAPATNATTTAPPPPSTGIPAPPGPAAAVPPPPAAAVPANPTATQPVDTSKSAGDKPQPPGPPVADPKQTPPHDADEF